MQEEELTKAEIVGAFGVLITVVGFALLCLAGLGAAIGSAAHWDGWFKTADITLAVSTIPLFGLGLFLTGHPPGSGPGFLKDK